MKRFILFTILILLISVLFTGQEATKPKIPKKSTIYDFRKTSWGMSKQQVKSIEKLKLQRETDIALIYQETVLGMTAVLVYYFNDNKLFKGYYDFVIRHSNKNDYINDYKKLKFALVDKYGIPDDDIIKWKNDLYKNDPQDWGMAISVGHLVYLTIWKKERSDIGIMLSGDNYKIKLTMQADSKIVKHKEQDESDKF